MANGWDVYLPGETEPTDLIGYADYLVAGEALGVPVQCSDYFLYVEGNDRTEIGPTG